MSTLLLSTADWDAPLWTNKQYVALALAGLSDVEYWNSIGLRSPRLNLADISRVLNKVRGSRRHQATKPPPQNLMVKNPGVIPFHKNRVAARLNQVLFSRGAREWKRSNGTKIFWTYSPVTYDLEKYADKVIYHCVDFLGQLEGVDENLIVHNERRLAGVPGIEAIASSMPIAEHLKSLGFKRVHYWPNVADVEAFASATVAADDRTGFVFAGNLTPTKVDFSALLQVADLGKGELHIAGPAGIDGTTATAQLAALMHHPNVRYHGSLAKEQMAELFNRCRVGLIPYVSNEYTRGVFPMKVYEYLASGLDVVASGLPSLAAVAGVTLVAPGNFALAVDTVPPATSASVNANRSLARDRSWATRATMISELIRGSAHE